MTAIKKPSKTGPNWLVIFFGVKVVFFLGLEIFARATKRG